MMRHFLLCALTEMKAQSSSRVHAADAGGNGIMFATCAVSDVKRAFGHDERWHFKEFAPGADHRGASMDPLVDTLSVIAAEGMREEAVRRFQLQVTK